MKFSLVATVAMFLCASVNKFVFDFNLIHFLTIDYFTQAISGAPATPSLDDVVEKYECLLEVYEEVSKKFHIEDLWAQFEPELKEKLDQLEQSEKDENPIK